jgi:hypothetical protein
MLAMITILFAQLVQNPTPAFIPALLITPTPLLQLFLPTQFSHSHASIFG